MESGRMDALVLKLRHPLTKIRSRSLQSLLFKLRERLVRVSELEPLQKTLIPSLLASLEPPLELQALHVLQLLVQSRSEVLLASLQHFGAAQKLQRVANDNAELRDTYEKLLRQIYVSNLVPVEESNSDQASTSEEEERSPVEERFEASRDLVDRRRAPEVDELEARGWSFAPVTLTSVDEQHLFEFEVKLQLRTEVPDLVAACATFRNDFLRNFPPEVFLQRPAVLQYLLHLVQQPILPGSPGTMNSEPVGENVLMKRAMEVSMGVNYFDEMTSATFSSKRGNLSGAVCMASLKALESLLYALQLTRRICLDPAYHVHAPSAPVELFDSYDTRRVLYPRASVEIGADSKRDRDTTGQLDQYSLSGAVYRIFMSTLPLLRSARHPRLHLLNLLITALPDLREKGCIVSAEASGLGLDNVRLERIFEVLSGICRPVTSEQANGLFDEDLELTHSMAWKLVELVLRLLRLHPSSRYHVENTHSASGNPQENTSADGIVIPRLLWEAVKLWVASPLFPDVAANEWEDESLVQCLLKIDETIPAFVNLKHSSLQDAKLVLDLVDFAKVNRDKLADFGPWEKPAIINLDVVQKAIQARCAFDDTDSEIIADVTLQAVWSALATEPMPDVERLARSDAETIHAILCDLLSDFDEKKTPASHESMSARFFCGLVDLVGQASSRLSADRPRQLISEVICEPKFLTLLLLVLARQSEDSVGQELSAALWGILRLALDQLASASGDNLLLLQPAVPLLQHFAYIEPSEGSSQEQRSTQPQLAEVLNRVEAAIPDHMRHLLICRCLLHESPYIRKAAASGILRLVSLAAPASVDYVSKDKGIREDPFGAALVGDGKRLDLETKLMEEPLPVTHTSDYQPSENELSSQLTKLSHLRKVISATSCAFESMKEAALKELVTLLENASVELFSLLEELDKFSDLVDLLRSILQAGPSQRDSPMIHQALLLLRTLLLRSRLLRSAMQRDNGMMALLLPLIFHSSASVRAQMYYILLLLTCSAENFIPNGTSAASWSDDNHELSGEARIPEMIKSTFGLYSNRWTRCFITTCSLKQQLQASAALLTQRTDSSWLKEVRSIIKQTAIHEDRVRTSNDQIKPLLGAEYALVAQKLREASSHGKCLNALYQLMTLCEAWKYARERFVGEWEADFERYFAVPPKSERDEIIIGSLVSALSVVFCAMTRREQLRALVVVKRKVLPLLKRSQSMAFSLQVARLLLNVSESKVGDLFLSLAADTDIISTICTKYSAMYATEPVLHAMMLEVLLRFANGMDDTANAHLSTPSREKICKRLRDMLSPLLSVVCRHRIPGSFLARDVFVSGSQCMVAILRTLPRESLLDGDSTLEHTDSSMLLDGSWASRFLFDHVSPIRELGFLIIEHTASSSPPSTRLLDMAFETSTDDTESDAVRAAACNVLTKEIYYHRERPPDHQAAMVELFHGTTFAGEALRSLSCSLKGDKLAPRTARSFARLVRVLYVQRKSLVACFGDMAKELTAAEEEYEIYPLLVQVLSLREWKSKCTRYCSLCMLLPSCTDDAWKRSMLPAILDMMIEVLNLLQAVCRDGGFDQVVFFLMHTTLRYQLMELVRDVLSSFKDSQIAHQSHYEVLDLCAGTLSILLVQAFDRQGEYNSEQFGAPTTIGFGAEFVAVVASLLEPRHPTEFRVSFSRVVPALSLLIPGSLKSSDANVVNALCSAVYDLYQEISEFRPLDATRSASSAVSEGQGRIFPLASIRRVSCALQVLLETSPVLQHLVRGKRAIRFAMTSIKECFSAIRIAGGFGGRRARSSNASANPHDAYVLELCGRIQTNFEVIGAIIGGEKESQRLAKDEGLLSVLLPNWSLMKMAHVRGSQVMLHALRLLANYTYGNDTARSSMLISLARGSGKVSGGDAAHTLLSVLFDLASSRGDVASSRRQSASAVTSSAADMALSNAACQVLKAVLLNTECVLASVKAGSISGLVESLQERLKQARQTSKTTQLENENLAHMLGVLGSIACGEEGARILYTSWATVLSLVFADAMHSTDEAVRRSGCLLLRNLALSQATKNNFALWEDMLDDMVALCVRLNSATRDDLTTLGYLSAALWSLVYDNQKARALLLSKPAALQSLQQLLRSHSTDIEVSEQSEPQASSKEIAGNLRRVLMLVQE